MVKPELTIASEQLGASNLIVLVKTNLCSLFRQNYFEKQGISIVFFFAKNSALSRYSPLLDIYWRIDIASSVASQIAAFAIVYK